MSQSSKYGSFIINHNQDKIHSYNAIWNNDPSVELKLLQNLSNSDIYEGVWNPCVIKKDLYNSALAGVCIWSKYDCLFHFNAICKGNPSAVRSLSSPRDKLDLLNRLRKGQKIEKIVISPDPIGHYQMTTIDWQASIINKFNIKHLYYVLPFYEYSKTIDSLSEYIDKNILYKLKDVLAQHHNELKQYIKNHLHTKIEFIYPMQINPSLTIEQSYTWPYENLQVDLGIEEMEEVRIPYQVYNNNIIIPPILLGMLGLNSPYNQKRFYKDNQSLTIIDSN